MPKPSEYQEKVRQGNRMLVLSYFEEGLPVRFKDLNDVIGLSPMGLSKVLKDLEKKRLLKHYLHGSRPAYKITKKGISVKLDTITLELINDRIKKDGGKYFHDYSKLRPTFESKGMPLGIKDDVVIDKDLEKELAPILREVIKNFQEDIFDKFLDESKMKDIHLEKLIDKKIIIGFSIDFNSLLKLIKESTYMMFEQELNRQGIKISGGKSIRRRAKRK